MTQEGLSDLDELVIRCRSAAARTYIAEAVACYKAAAYRAAIVATWIAASFDFLAKLRELEMTGDANAKRKLEEFESARASGNIKASLEFERTLIDSAQEQFELLSPIEAMDIRRLFEDRNRCAHPSMSSAYEPYDPSAELARAHIRNVVIHLLQQAPVQGKAALDRILTDIKSDYFPVNAKQAVEFFKNGPLVRARRPLVRNLVIVLSKELLTKGFKDLSRARRHAALNAILEMYVDTGEGTLASVLPELVGAVPDETFYRVVFLIGSVPKSWNVIGNAAQIKVRNYIPSASEDAAYRFLPYAVLVPALRQLAQERLAVASAEVLGRVIRKDPSVDYVEMALAKFEGANTFRDAESRCELLVVPLAHILTATDIDRVVNAFLANSQITYAHNIPELYAELLKNTPLDKTRPSWKRLFDLLSDESKGIQSPMLLTALKERYKF